MRETLECYKVPSENKRRGQRLKEAKEEFGILLRRIEYLVEHPETNKVDTHTILKSAMEFRDLLEKI